MIGTTLTGVRGGRFVLETVLGQGGFGRVYRGRDERGTAAAIKVFPGPQTAGLVRSFEQEVQATNGLSHPNILSIIDFGSVDETGRGSGLFVVSEFCEGGNYRDVLSRTTRPADPAAVVVAFDQILNGLDTLHSRIVHRDLKPENVLLANGCLKIGDFGLSKFIDQTTRSTTFKGWGTLPYMAPELFGGQRATVSSDLYAIGVMLYEALTGQLPFGANSEAGWRDAHTGVVAPPPSRSNPNVPPHLDDLVARLLAKLPQARPACAADVRALFNASPQDLTPEVASLVDRARRYADEQARRRGEEAHAQDVRNRSAAAVRALQQELVREFDAVVGDVNGALGRVVIDAGEHPIASSGRRFSVGRADLLVEFFGDELPLDGVPPGLADVLQARGVRNAGRVVLRDNTDREGWNLVLVGADGPAQSTWHLVETRDHPLMQVQHRFEPYATDAKMFLTDLGHHFSGGMHSRVLEVRQLSRREIARILNLLVPGAGRNAGM